VTRNKLLGNQRDMQRDGPNALVLIGASNQEIKCQERSSSACSESKDIIDDEAQHNENQEDHLKLSN